MSDCFSLLTYNTIHYNKKQDRGAGDGGGGGDARLGVSGDCGAAGEGGGE